MKIRSVLVLTGLIVLTFPWSVCAQKKQRVVKPASNNSVQKPSLPSQNQIFTNLRAFTKLYGYVRYFHPSDEAIQIPWDKFAVYGTAKVKNARNTGELKTILEKLFLPIAPTLQILQSGKKPEAVAQATNNTSFKPVAWQHKGVGVGVFNLYGINTPYRSVRLNRNGAEYAKSGKQIQSILSYYIRSSNSTLEALGDKYVKLSVALRTDLKDDDGGILLYFEATSVGGKKRARGTSIDQPIVSPAWSDFSLLITTRQLLPENIQIAILPIGRGKFWVDNVRLWFSDNEYRGPWKPFHLDNHSFEIVEKDNLGNDVFPAWECSLNKAHIMTASSEERYHGKRSLHIEDVGTRESSFRQGIFTAKPNNDELLIKELGGGLQCALPLVLFTDGKKTLGSTTTSTLALSALFQDSLNAIQFAKRSMEQESVRLANVIMAWNVLQHFYPYFDVGETNWDSTLTVALQATLRCTSTKDFGTIMRKMLAGLHDGHAEFYSFETNRIVPATIENVEGKPVVMTSADSLLKRGDVLLTVDGKQAWALLKEEENLVSGSPQYKRYQAAQNLTRSESKRAYLAVQRGEDTISIALDRKPAREVALFEHPAIKQISGSQNKDTTRGAVWYIDLAQVSVAEIEAKANEFAQAKGIVLDMRGYPQNGNAEILGYLTDSALLSPRYLIPQIIYPDHENVQDYDTSGRWRVPPKLPRWKGKIVFLTGGGAISQAEDIMSIVEHYKLGEIVGETTAGADGNVNILNLPSGSRIRWTGMKVLKHDGSQHHLVGIKPTIPAVRTVQGVRAGRDEVLEKALSLIP
ncbi:MAG: hypothetical protein H9535_21820 [Ignavibacteria bacterium]|nr:hypothetical protein [Ignavibacteria bacterium]